jgi:hypothetical protein
MELCHLSGAVKSGVALKVKQNLGFMTVSTSCGGVELFKHRTTSLLVMTVAVITRTMQMKFTL